MQNESQKVHPLTSVQSIFQQPPQARREKSRTSRREDNLTLPNMPNPDSFLVGSTQRFNDNQIASASSHHDPS